VLGRQLQLSLLFADREGQLVISGALEMESCECQGQFLADASQKLNALGLLCLNEGE
jgi:hypothetical protein